MDSHDDSFPEDLSGHFWTRLIEIPNVDRWRYEIVDYQNNVVAEGLAVSPAQAARFVRAWDSVACREFEGGGDPSLSRPGHLR